MTFFSSVITLELYIVDSNNRTALYIACMQCNIAMVRFLIKRNANPSIACMIDDKNEETPLGCAVRWGYTEVTSKRR